MDGITIITLTNVGAGIVLVALGIPLYQGRVPPNAWYGCRTEKSLSDEQIWYAVNRVTGRDLIVAGIIVLAVAVALFFVRHRINENLTIGILLATIVLSIGRMVIHSARALRNV